MTRFAELLTQADHMPTSKNGMVISACGRLTIAARALNEMPGTPDLEDDYLEVHQTRLEDVQRCMAVYSLETILHND